MKYVPPSLKVSLSDIEEVLPERYRNYGTYVSTICPFHADSTPSLMIYEDSYRCLACPARGSTQALIQFYKNGSTKIRKPNTKNSFTPNPFSEWTRFDSLPTALNKNWRRLQAFPKAAGYLNQRGITNRTIEKLGIGFGDGWFSIPFFDSLGNVKSGVARAGLEIKADLRYILAKGADGLYVPSYKRIEKLGYSFVVFGILDAVSLWQIGLPVISTLNGKRVNPEHFDSFRCRLVFVPDFGEEEAAHVGASKLGWRGSVIQFPYERFGSSKDMNDCLQHNATLLQSKLLQE